MARLLSLTIKAFKSFGRLTSINFSQKLTGIVGPNGSGKSNVMDAIFFVIGSSRISAMRAKKGGELIFNSKTIKPEYAEVRLAIDNSNKEFGESWGDTLTIARRVKADGLSAYRVNGRRMNRNQVVDIIAKAKIFPDGHNIIQQGEIAGLVKKNADERRQIIEELAGIREYDEKKHKAFLELSSVEQKINEINSLLRERQRNLERLKKEREQAQRYETLLDVKRKFEDSIVKRKVEAREDEKRKLSGEKESEEKALLSLKTTLSEHTGNVDLKKKELSRLDREISLLQSGENLQIVKESERLSSAIQSKEARVSQIDEQVLAGKKRRSAIAEREIPDLKTQLEKRRARASELESEISSLSAEIAVLEKEKASLLLAFSKESEFEREFEEKRAKAQKAVSDHSSEERRLSLEAERAQASARRLEEDREHSEKALFDLRKRLSERVTEAKRLEKKQGEILSRVKSVSSELSEKKEALSLKSAEISNATSRISVLSSKLGDSESGKRQATDYSRFPGFLGRLSAFIKGSPKGVSALGSSLLPNSIVVSDKNSALEIAEFVKHEGLPRISIVVASDNSSESPKSKSPIESIVSFSNERILPAIESLFFSKTIAKSLKDAVEKGDAITEEGDLVYSGGRIIEVGEIVLREKIEEALLQEKALLSRAKEESLRIEREVSEIASKLSSEEASEREISIELSRLSPSKQDAFEEKRLIEKIAEAEKERDKFLVEKEKLLKDISREKETLALAEKALLEISPPKKAAFDFTRMKKVEEDLSKLQKKLSNETLELSENRLRIENFISPEIESLGRLLKGLEKEEEKILAEKEAEISKIASLRKKAEEFEKTVQEKLSSLKELREKKDAFAKEVEKEEKKSYELVAKKSAVESKVALLSLRIEAEDRDLSSLLSQIEGKTVFFPGTIKGLTSKLSIISDRIARLGAINQRALLEFEEAEVEFKEVDVKKATLDEERQAIVSFMENVEKRKKEVFLEHYNSISANFARIYSRLSGGIGELFLENPETIFEGGLLITAKPPGKEVSRIDLLSGGEQTMAALAFIFAIQEHSPAPFYILDEVDAALDKENSDKLSSLLSLYSGTSQIIVITHNDNVMRVCDQLVGVYLNRQDGISRIVSQPTPEFLKKVAKSIGKGEADISPRNEAEEYGVKAEEPEEGKEEKENWEEEKTDEKAEEEPGSSLS